MEHDHLHIALKFPDGNTGVVIWPSGAAVPRYGEAFNPGNHNYIIDRAGWIMTMMGKTDDGVDMYVPVYILYLDEPDDEDGFDFSPVDPGRGSDIEIGGR